MIKIASIALALSLVASAASAQIAINTQNIATPAGAERFERDLRKTANRLCNAYRGVEGNLCRADVREEALSLLPTQQRLAYLRSQNNNTRYALNLNNNG